MRLTGLEVSDRVERTNPLLYVPEVGEDGLEAAMAREGRAGPAFPERLG